MIAEAAQIDPLDGVGNVFLSQGIVGACCVALAVVVIYLWREIKAERAAHKVEIAAKDALINELQDQRLAEALAGQNGLRSVQTSLDAFLLAIRNGGRA